VEDNLDQLRGRPPRRRPGAVGVKVSRLALALLPLALVAGSPGISSPAAEQRPGPQEAPAGVVAPGTASDGAAAQPPGPLDPGVFPLAVERVVLDPGHGGDNGGTRTPSGMVEKDLTLDIALRLQELLEADGFAVVLTRDRDVEMTLEERVELANREQADLFLSIHVNWIENRTVRGVETYYLGTSDDPFVGRLAAAENHDSGYAMADLRGLLAQLYAGLRQDASQRAAAAVQRSLLRSLRTVNPAVEDRGVKTAPFIVLMKTEMPAVLAEVSCLSNQQEAELLGRPLYRQYIAEALASGIVSYAGGRRAAATAGRSS
jgi:N-acetylmuramoyl-L-alanine amidase